jgi:thiol-disulfide isomerase/thioredoxin
MKNALAAGLAIALLAATPVPTAMPDPNDATVTKQLWPLVGKSAAALTILPIGGTEQPLATAGKPTVVIAFASWCFACIDEMPRNVADYAKYKDRVSFVWLDFDDAPASGDKVVAKYAIPAPVVRDGGRTAAMPAPSPNPGATPPPILGLPGVSPKDLPEIVAGLAKALPPEKLAMLKDVATHCAGITDAACIAYAASKGIVIGGKPSTGAGDDFGLPLTYVIDARGIVVKRIVGYDTGHDDLAAALAKLGVKPASSR